MLFQYQQFAQNLPGLLAGQGGAPQTQGAPAGQTIPGQLAEVGYLQGMGGGGASPGAMTPEAGWYGPGGTGVPGGPATAPAGAQALSEQEQARWQQLMARDQQIRASGGPGLEGADLDEARRLPARGATYAAPTAPAAPPTGGPTGPGGGASGNAVSMAPTGSGVPAAPGWGVWGCSGARAAPPVRRRHAVRPLAVPRYGGAMGNAMIQTPTASAGVRRRPGGVAHARLIWSWFTPYADWGGAAAARVLTWQTRRRRP
jgi:hypothetical protein